MGSTIDDVHHQDYLEDQFHEEQREKAVEQYIKEQRYEYLEQIDKLLANLSITELSDYYKSSLETSVKNELWEYCVTLIWKVVVLFFYESLFQINQLNRLHADLQDSLNSNNRDCLSPFSFNCIKDKTLCDKMPRIWRNLDVNYQNSCSSLLDERNSLSHVNEYPYSEVKFKAFLEKSVEILDYIQTLHLNSLPDIVQSIKDNGSFPNLSQIEIDQLINDFLQQIDVLEYLLSLITSGKISDDQIERVKDFGIKKFVSSDTFDTAYENGKKIILPLISQFSESDYKILLMEVFTAQEGNSVNQVIEAGRIEKIFEQMYLESINTFPKIKNSWDSFLDKVAEMGLSRKYNSLSLD